MNNIVIHKLHGKCMIYSYRYLKSAITIWTEMNLALMLLYSSDHNTVIEYKLCTVSKCMTVATFTSIYTLKYRGTIFSCSGYLGDLCWTSVLFSCPHWCGHQRPGGHAGSSGLRLLLCPVSLPAAPPVGPWSLVIPPHVQLPMLLLLQKLCFHPGAFLVWVSLWLLCTSKDLTFSVNANCRHIKNLIFTNTFFVLYHRLCMTNGSSPCST